MNLITLEDNENFIPWYERMNQKSFEKLVKGKMAVGLGLSAKEAEDKYREFENIKINDELCRRREGLYSFRYYVINELKNIGLSFHT